jgi:sec-independent protein translocase protein TatA
MSVFHWLIVMVIVLLLFGNRLPSVMRSLGRGVTEFKKGLDSTDEDDANESIEKPKKTKPSAEIEGNGSAKDEKTEKSKEKQADGQ